MSYDLFPTDTFGLEGVAHEIVEKYHPLYFAHGGEHIVYEVDGHPDVIIKADARKLNRVMHENIKNDRPVDYFDEEYRRKAEESIKSDKERTELLKEYFGAEHIPAMRKYVMEVPMTKQIMEYLFKEKMVPETPAKVTTIVGIQRKVEHAADESSKWLVAGYSEFHPMDMDVYGRITNDLVFEEKKDIDVIEFLQVHGAKPLRDLVNEMRKNEQMREKVKELVMQCIAYTEQTGQILDLTAKNLVFTKEDDRYNYHLIDVLYPSSHPILSEAKEALDKFSCEVPMDKGDASNVLNVMKSTTTGQSPMV